MASSKVMASSSSANSDLARQSSIYSLKVAERQSDRSKNFGSVNMDDLFKNIYGDNPAASDGESNGGMSGAGGNPVEENWKEIVAIAGGGGAEPKQTGVGEGQYLKDPAYEEMMTLEAFLAKAGAVREEDVGIQEAAGPGQGVFPVDSRFQQQQQVDGSIVVFGNGAGGGGGQGRGKRRLMEEPVDKVTQQRQRRMIKNRESAARSRERKQAYTVELESLVTRLEEENARLLREEEEQTKKRFKQLMEYLIPIQEKRRPPRVLRRVRSMQW